MNLKISRLSTNQLEELSKRAVKKPSLLQMVQKELRRRGILQKQAQSELKCIPKGHRHKALLAREIEARYRLLLLDKSDLRYRKLYPAWTKLRDEGVKVGVYQFFITSKKERWENAN